MGSFPSNQENYKFCSLKCFVNNFLSKAKRQQQFHVKNNILQKKDESSESESLAFMCSTGPSFACLIHHCDVNSSDILNLNALLISYT